MSLSERESMTPNVNACIKNPRRRLSKPLPSGRCDGVVPPRGRRPLVCRRDLRQSRGQVAVRLPICGSVRPVGAGNPSLLSFHEFGCSIGRYVLPPMNLATTFRRLLVGRMRWLLANGDERDAEILALRHQILVLQRQVNRPRFSDTDRTILAVFSTVLARSRLQQIMLIVQPKTVIGWHRRLVARHWTYPPTRHAADRRLARRSVGSRSVSRPKTRRGVIDGCMGSCTGIGHRIAASTVWTILRAAGIDPAPGRTGPTWAQFIRHASQRHHRDRLRLRRHRNPPPVPCALLHRDRHPAGTSCRDHHQPDRTMDHPSRPELLDEHRPSVPVCHP